MKIASFKAGPVASYGIVTDAGIIDAGRRLKNFPTLKSLLAHGAGRQVVQHHQAPGLCASLRQRPGGPALGVVPVARD